MAGKLAVGLAEIHEAQDVFFGPVVGSDKPAVSVRRTPMLADCQTATDAPTMLLEQSIRLSFKLENMQALGCFKTRGMVYKMHQLAEREEKVEELVSMSAGNFGRTMAHLCKAHAIPAVLFMPSTVPEERLRYIHDVCGAKTNLAPGIELADRVLDYCQAHPKAHFAHPFDDEALFAGYGSIGLEILQQTPDVDVVIVPVGGGGLIAGVATAIKEHTAQSGGKPVRVIGVEPEGAASMYQSIKEGKQHHLSEITTFANGLAPPFAGEKALQYVRRYVDQMVLVTDEQIKQAMATLFNQYKIVAESGAAAALAALLNGSIAGTSGKSVVCIVSGGNIDANEMQKWIGSL